MLPDQPAQWPAVVLVRLLAASQYGETEALVNVVLRINRYRIAMSALRPFIAAQAHRRGATLATAREFARAPGLETEDWAA
jgi:predicted nucleic acid-binding protein